MSVANLVGLRHARPSSVVGLRHARPSSIVWWRHSLPSCPTGRPGDPRSRFFHAAATFALILLTAALVSAQGRGARGATAAPTADTGNGEKIYNQSCATGYCHGVKGASGGAPRLASRGFDAAYITQVVRSGIQGTGMPAFGTQLSRLDLAAVISYVGTLNGIAPAPLPPDRGMPRRQLPPEAAKGRAMFYDAIRGFGRCSVCHQVDGTGIAVADPIAKVPDSVAALRALASPHVVNATAEGSTFPALVLSKGAVTVKLYDLTTRPPVLRTFLAKEVQIGSASNWSHNSAMAAYNDAELESILAFLKVSASAEKP
jgi:mono/diheme cytochrome c family protein